MRGPASWTTVLAVALAAGSPMLSRRWFTRLQERRWVEAGLVASLVVSTVALLGLPTVNVLGLQPTVNVLQSRGDLLVVIWLVGSGLELLGLLARHRLPRVAVVPPAL